MAPYHALVISGIAALFILSASAPAADLTQVQQRLEFALRRPLQIDEVEHLWLLQELASNSITVLQESDDAVQHRLLLCADGSARLFFKASAAACVDDHLNLYHIESVGAGLSIVSTTFDAVEVGGVARA